MISSRRCTDAIKKLFVVLFYLVLTVMYARHTQKSIDELFTNSSAAKQIQINRKEVIMERKQINQSHKPKSTKTSDSGSRIMI